jgi:hypothetical protein
MKESMKRWNCIRVLNKGLPKLSLEWLCKKRNFIPDSKKTRGAAPSQKNIILVLAVTSTSKNKNTINYGIQKFCIC